MPRKLNSFSEDVLRAVCPVDPGARPPVRGKVALSSATSVHTPSVSHGTLSRADSPPGVAREQALPRP